MTKKVTPVNEWQKAVLDHIKLLGEQEKREFAHKILFDVAYEVGANGYESIGLLETVKLNLMDFMSSDIQCDGDCDNCSKK